MNREQARMDIVETLYTSVLKQRRVRPHTAKPRLRKKNVPCLSRKPKAESTNVPVAPRPNSATTTTTNIKLASLTTCAASPYVLPLNTKHQQELRKYRLRKAPNQAIHAKSLDAEHRMTNALFYNHILQRSKLLNIQARLESMPDWTEEEQGLKRGTPLTLAQRALRNVCFDRLRLRIEGLWDELKIPQSERKYITVTYMNHRKGPDVEYCRLYMKGLLRHRQATIDVLRCIDDREHCVSCVYRTPNNVK